ncbi:MAG: RHS repeat-associated core domain-containing protein, partial [Phascolarctobacterium sp.]|nr:RHS repeat-associated core domain-containing protein [Phascolarctobacterium sp.]
DQNGKITMTAVAQVVVEATYNGVMLSINYIYEETYNHYVNHIGVKSYDVTLDESNPTMVFVKDVTLPAGSSWGKLLSTTGSLASTLGVNQPFRYRGYVYDAETGWYYLQSRYYDPSIARFISADVLLSTGQGVVGHNSYAYCLNNPIRYMDEGGESAAEALSWWTTTMWWLTAIDGPIPAGDIIYAVVMLVLGVATATASAPAISIPKAEEKEESEVITKDPGSPVIFPVNPYDFNPLGLVRVYRPGTKNGAFISWMDPVLNIEVFRWDENPNYPNGPHYHIYGSGHYEPGKDKVPEPFASIYFPFRSMN